MIANSPEEGDLGPSTKTPGKKKCTAGTVRKAIVRISRVARSDAYPTDYWREVLLRSSRSLIKGRTIAVVWGRAPNGCQTVDVIEVNVNVRDLLP